MKVIALLGQKGGSGKSALSHLLAHGLGLLGRTTILIQTDVNRRELDPTGRRYNFAYARGPEDFERKFAFAASKEAEMLAEITPTNEWVTIIDGAGNRSGIDQAIYRHANMTIIPFQPSPEPAAVAAIDAKAYPTAYLIPNGSRAANVNAAKRELEFVREALAGHEHRFLPMIPMIAALQELQATKVSPERLTKLTPLARQFATMVLGRIYGTAPQASAASPTDETAVSGSSEPSESDAQEGEGAAEGGVQAVA